jgi:flagellar basal body-associated protein FliL
MDLEQVKDAINAYFGDTSRSPTETKEGLEELQADIEGMLDALRADGVE